ncbi:hypothetical protein [Paraburkholderia sp.]|uniref:hypothetical protein n=1 Tax=Paraburkholderia sp. TaxID=1926495 RepID=UPI002389AD1C|nr:hypothetical protein [Paraburkholderia sp.]MDE1183941.1 hypothetical protein [Paraburkholderia sp.]
MPTRTLTFALAAGSVVLSACMMDPPGPSPIYSRLPSDQTTAGARPLTPDERKQYDAIDREVLAEQNQAIANDAAAQAWARYYTPPVTVYGSYYSGGGWGRGWGTGVGYGWGGGYGPGWGW